MSGNRLTIFDTTLRDGEQAPGFSLRIDEKLKMARQLQDARRRHHRGRFPDCVRRGRRSGPDDRHPRARTGHRRARALPFEGRRARRLGALPGAAPPHPRLHRDLRSAPRAEAPDLARGVPAHRDGGGTPRPQPYRRRAVLGRGRDAERSALPVADDRSGHPGGREDDQPARHRRLLDAGRSRRASSSASSPGCRARIRSPSARIATTISAWRSRTRCRRSTPARARSSARSTASASAPATRRSKRS